MKKNSIVKIIVIIFSLLIITGIIVYIFIKNQSLEQKQPIVETEKNLIEDNTPVLELTDYKINEGESYNINSFIKSYSKNYTLKFENEDMANFTKPGNYQIAINAIGDDDDIVTEHAYLIISDNKENATDKKDNISETGATNKEEKEESEKETNNNVNHNTNSNEQSNKTKPTQPINPPTTKPNKTTTSSQPTITTLIKVDSTTETTESYTYKYGTTIKKITYSYYDIYSDGSKELTGNSDSYEYDYSTFNGTTNDLKDEATSLASQNSGAINSVLGYVNQYRSEVGAPQITLDYSLTVAAEIRALEMGWADYFSHTRPNGSSCFSVVDELGIGYYAVGENIAYGYWDAASVSDGWRNSPGHYSNMISTNFSKIGIGMANVNGSYYWVQLFTN